MPSARSASSNGGARQSELVFRDHDGEVLERRGVSGIDALHGDARNRDEGIAILLRDRAATREALIETGERLERDGGVQLRLPRVEPDEPGVVVAGIAVVAPDAHGGGEVGVVGRDEATFTGDDDLRRAHAEDLDRAERSHSPVASRRAEGVGRVEHDGDPRVVRHRLERFGRRTARRTRGSRRTALTPAMSVATAVVSTCSDVGSHSTNSGSSPFQRSRGQKPRR